MTTNGTAVEDAREAGQDAATSMPHGPEPWTHDRRWTAAAILVFGLAAGHLFSGYLGADLMRVVPANVGTQTRADAGDAHWDALGETDLRFVVWLIARNAYTIVHQPARLFDAEQCHPAKNALALGESGIGLGLLAAPIQLVVRDPIATFNLTLLAMTAVAALAMFLLIRDWTSSPPAGIVAGLLYAFHLLKIGDVVHVIIWDTAWTVLALYFATRVFRLGRWWDVIGLAVVTCLQIAGSLYPLLAAVVIAIPFVVWLLRCYGLRGLRAAQMAALVLLIGGATALLAGPYLHESQAGGIAETPYQVYRPLSYLLPSGVGFSGWVILVLAVVALVPGPGHLKLRLGGDPRWALLVGGLLIFSLSVVGEGGPGEATFPVIRDQPPPKGFPNLYLALSGFIPGLDVVRGPGAMYGGVHLILCLLAGIGAAGLLGRVPPRLALASAWTLIGLAGLDTLRPSYLGLEPRIDYRMVELRPRDDELELFEALDASGDAGPLLEYPVNHLNFWKASRGLILSAYHHRPTSYCYNSFFPPEAREVERLGKALPGVAPLAALREMGFRTLVVHHADGELGAALHRKRFELFVANAGGDALLRLRGNDSLTAYRILP